MSILKYIIFFLLVSPICAETHIIFFTATWCPPCQRLKVNLQDKDIQQLLKKTNNHIIDIDEYSNYSKSYGINSVPQTIIVDYDGKDTKIIKRIGGYLSKDQLRGLLESHE